MKTSFSYFLVSLVLKLKGVKKTLSCAPVNYHKLRKEDVKKPNGIFYKNAKRFTILNSLVTELKSKDNSNKIILYIHGGAFVSGPAQHHWDSIKTIYKRTDFNIWMCDYPKAPESKIIEISKNIDAVYKEILKIYKAENIIIIGDSVGATLATSLVQRLVDKKQSLPVKIILISPVMDATLSNTAIPEIDKKDIMLSRKGVLSAKKLCAENDNLKAVEISPINGNFRHFPETILFVAENDITYPDQLRVIQNLKDNKINFDVITGENMPHIWPLIPVLKEGKQALNKLIDKLNN